jgi:radical SAM-linked protein
MRIRFRFAKLGKIRFTSQRDVARMWERALRRAGLPLDYSKGFSPRPQLSFGLALPTGCESLAEYVDVVLDGPRAEAAGIEVDALPERLTHLLPDGIDVQAVAPADRRAGSLQQLVTSCSWTMSFTGVTRAELESQVTSLLGASSVPIERERKGKQEQDDLRPSVWSLAVADDATAGDVIGDHTHSSGRTGPAGGSIGVTAELATQPRGVRPIELVRGLIAVSGGSGKAGSTPGTGVDRTQGVPVLDRACRTQQWIERDGIRREPLAVSGVAMGDARAAHALERAS